MGVLALRGWRMLQSPEIPFRHRMEVLALFGLAFACQLFCNHGHYNFAFIIGIALADKYTAPFSASAIWRRRQAARLAASAAYAQAAPYPVAHGAR
jgi:hypothetical protein